MPKILKENVSLADRSYMKVGGRARYFLEFDSVEKLKSGLEEWQKIGGNFDKMFVIGDATNVLFSDDGFDGLILHNKITGIEQKTTYQLEVGTGTTIEEINNFCITNSLGGLAWSGGLPGTLGGAIFGNAGAFGGETKDTILSVKSYDYLTGEMITRTKEACQFDYRQSVFKKESKSEIILSAILQLQSGDVEAIKSEVESHIDYRESRQPLDFPSLGSTFKNIPVEQFSAELLERVESEIKTDPFPVVPIAYLISLVGLKGHKIGGAQISEKHPNFILNLGDAKTADILALIDLVIKRISLEFHVVPEPEIRVVS